MERIPLNVTVELPQMLWLDSSRLTFIVIEYANPGYRQKAKPVMS